jgi:hypothetical protein
MSEYQHPLPLVAKPEPMERPPVDWEIVKRIMPKIVTALLSVFWLLYVFLPLAFNTGHLSAFSFIENLTPALLSLCLLAACVVAIEAERGDMVVIFAIAYVLLVNWY